VKRNKRNRRRTYYTADYNTVYPNPITHSSMVGRYSTYPGIFFLILILIGLLAGITPAVDGFIDLNNLGRTEAGIVWLKLTFFTAIIAIAVYWFEDRYDSKYKRVRYLYEE